jgi:hypothetical protein
LCGEIQDPPALYHHAAAISVSVDEFAFPLSVANEFGVDLLQRLRELRLQELVANSAYGFLFLPTIQLLGVAVPKVYSTFYGASHDAIIYALQKILILLR